VGHELPPLDAELQAQRRQATANPIVNPHRPTRT
jgi:hypothetical protein